MIHWVTVGVEAGWAESCSTEEMQFSAEIDGSDGERQLKHYATVSLLCFTIFHYMVSVSFKKILNFSVKNPSSIVI